ncbi:MAG: bifunctional phosphoserine phosphatase/homoserine phosphotransferase ThrH [Defluviicoccus sp.]|nr:bifunctional phosphoserine phosphatase/homoserine phosphotransferase ThrH [Defluviicoccus sp.]MDE0383619.1 bifunctional phosphoserine phosphatase/homoserine phosphotransferase ThrH [Defluviicoccus sp.]
MRLFCLDLEGVLIPEIWIGLAERTGIDALRATTRDVSDYDALMRQRLRLLERHRLGLRDVEAVVAKMAPLPGAREFLRWLRELGPVIVLSDTYREFAGPLMAQLDLPALFCHSLVVGPDGDIVDYRLRHPDHKRASVEAFRALNFHVTAAGDSHNDIAMLKAADAGILFRAPAALRQAHPGFAAVEDYGALSDAIRDCASAPKCDAGPCVPPPAGRAVR